MAVADKDASSSLTEEVDFQKLYTEDEAVEKALPYFDGDRMAAETFLKKYAVQPSANQLEGADGKFLEATPGDMWDRLAETAASVEEDSEYWEKKFRQALDDFKVVPQGSIMFALGNPYQKSSCSNCFVLPLEDSIEGIFQTMGEMAKTYSYRGGVGVDLSKLRPRNTAVRNAARKSTGAVSFMDLFSHVTGLIGQANRRGALMISISDRHPDLYNPEGDMDFLTIKRDLDMVNNANISVRVSDDFMWAVENDEEWTLSWRREDNEIYCGHDHLAHDEGPDLKVERTYPAREIWDTMIESATESAEPGIIYWDRVREEAPSDQYVEEGFKTISTNPCSELPLGEYGACTLLSINLTQFVEEPFTDDAHINYDKLEEHAEIATRFLDNVKTIDADMVPLEGQAETAKNGRRIGVGTHGLGDTLAMLEHRYDSDGAVDACEEIYSNLRNSVYSASVDLAKEKEPFPVFDWDKHKRSPFIQRLPEDLKQDIKENGLRNIACLTLAPTGTVSMISQTSSGIEPIFRLRYKRRVRQDGGEKVYDVFHPLVEEYFEHNEDAESLEDLPEYFQTVADIEHIKRTELQGTIQKYIDHSISNTINIPADMDDVQDVVDQSYRKAWHEGCKGYTVYVDGSREEAPLQTEEEDPEVISEDLQYKADTRVWEFSDEHGKYYLIEGEDQIFVAGYEENGRPIHSVDRTAEDLRSMLANKMDDQDRLLKYVRRSQGPITKLARLTSLALKTNNAEEAMVTFAQNQKRDQLADDLFKIFEYRKIEAAEHCPECHSMDLQHSEGCVTCMNCGWSKCSK